MDVINTLRQLGIEPEPKKDQHFIVDDSILQRIANQANLSQDDTILEIGAGIGNLTQLIAHQVKKVIAVESDIRFEPMLRTLPANVEVHIENALITTSPSPKKIHYKPYNKIVSNLPYSLCEALLHKWAFFSYDKAILLIPSRFIETIKTHPVFSSFYAPTILFPVPRTSFYPEPKTESVVINLRKPPDPIESHNSALFLRQYLYTHEDQKSKNGLREGIIRYMHKVHDRTITKNEARRIIDASGIDPALLDSRPDNPDIYFAISSSLPKLLE